MSWHAVFEKVEPYIVSVATPDGMGTGFLFAYNADGSLVAVATAAHVIAHAHDWKLPIKLRHHHSKQEFFIAEDRRAIFLDRKRDSASILVFAEDVKDANLPTHMLPLQAPNMMMKVGAELGWSGFPAIAYPSLCMFTGRVSAYLGSKIGSYLIDGVAIHGVSGGPVFSDKGNLPPQLIGAVSAYMPNRVSGESLPGLLRVQDVAAFHAAIEQIKSFDDALAQQKEQAAKEVEQLQTPPGAGVVQGPDVTPGQDTLDLQPHQ
jgi:hypothetical protein